MFKTTSERLNHIDRVASHATKQRANGRIDDIPLWAQEPEQYYNSLRERLNLLGAQLRELQDALAGINEKRKHAMPLKEFEHLMAVRSGLRDKQILLEEEAKHYRSLARLAAEKSWSMVFYSCALRMLHASEFNRIEAEVQSILQRDRAGIKPGQQDRTPEDRKLHSIKARIHERRGDFRSKRKKLAKGSALYWSDENGGLLG